ncbi:MAG: hypothetical protein H6978_11575 [Gammaproteobacteria bacterium]|nr:hypothetical protein [Gammaproteobacteria bacterium]
MSERKSENQGEGNRSAALRYNRQATEFAQDHDTEALAREALDGEDMDEVEDAVEEGESRSRGFDPAVRRS